MGNVAYEFMREGRVIEKKPSRVYFESSVLISLGFRIDHSSQIQSFKEIANDLGIKMLAPNICVDEAVEKWSLEIEKSLKNVDEISRYLACPIQLEDWIGDRDQRRVALRQKYLSFLGSVEIGVVENAVLEQQRLVEMAVRKIPPFKSKGEKGFRDSIIVHTIARDFYPFSGEGSCLVISADCDIYNGLGDVGVSDYEVFKSVEFAADGVNQYLNATFRDHMSERTKTLLQYLNANHDVIETFVAQNVQFPRGFLYEASCNGTVRSVQSVRLERIVSSFPGHLPEGVQESDVQISFFVNVKIGVIVEPYFFEEECFRVGGACAEPKMSAILSSLTEPGCLGDKVSYVERYLPVNAVVHLKNDGSEEYSGLRLVSVEASVRSDMMMRCLGEP